jgi:hypothetical protein
MLAGQNLARYRFVVTSAVRWALPILVAACFWSHPASGQLDPVNRELIQFGYNAPLEGHPPLSAYAFYYHNDPSFLHDTNLVLRVAVAPTYVDSELGIRSLISKLTDFGVGAAGGGFADSYNEINQGLYLPSESFDGHGAEVNASLYHLFNPEQRVPLNGLVRAIAHFSTYSPLSDTSPRFQVPDDMWTLSLRSGLRWGGREPTLFPSLAMELSAWYEGSYRTQSGLYGFHDRQIESFSQLFWGQAYLAYTLPKWQHNFSVSLTAGTSANADRLSAYRLGGFLPLVSEYPLALPGYFYQEISARSFALFNGTYIVPLEPRHRWNLSVTAATAAVDYLPGLSQAGNWNSGVGCGVFYTSESWRVLLGYGYGVDAIRHDGRGANSIGLLVQLDLSHARQAFLRPSPPGSWQGFQRFLGVFGN